MKYILVILICLIVVFFACQRPVAEQQKATALKSAIAQTSDIMEGWGLTPLEDAYVRGGVYTNKNYGSSDSLMVKGHASNKDLKRNSYIKFSLASVSGSVTSAVLRVYGSNIQDAATVPLSVYSTTDGWSETGITYTNRPSHPTTPLDVVSVGSARQYYEFTVTDFVKSQMAGDNVASFVLKDNGDKNKHLAFLSRESATNKPELVITTGTEEQAPPPPIASKKPDHIIVLWEENKGYSQIVGSSSAPYINSLIPKGTLFTRAHGITHPSYPNYIHFFAGEGFGIGSNTCISGQPYSAPNLYTALKAAGKSFVWYSEGLPSAGSGACSSGKYREKHNPTTIFSNVPASANQPLSALNLTDTSTFKNLPDVICVTPNMDNDMHDQPVSHGDAWLKSKFSKLIEWCVKNNAVFMVYYDEDNGKEDNRIPVLAVGGNVKAGYKATGDYNHYNFHRMILDAMNARPQHPNITNAKPITEIWK